MNDTLTNQDFKQWANDPMTVKVRNHLLQERSQYASLDQSLADKVANIKEPETLETLGLDSAMRMSVCKGIEIFTDFDALYSELFPEAAEKAEGGDA